MIIKTLSHLKLLIILLVLVMLNFISVAQTCNVGIAFNGFQGTGTTSASIGQSFTACGTGRINEVQLGNLVNTSTATVLVRVYQGDGFAGTLLGQMQAGPVGSNRTNRLNISSLGIIVQSGQKYTVRFSTVIGGPMRISYSQSNRNTDWYTGGRLHGAGTAISDIAMTVKIGGVAQPTLFPVHQETAASRSLPLTMTFNTPVEAGTGNIVVREVASNHVVETIPVDDLRIQGALVVVPVSSAFTDTTEYSCAVPSGAIVSDGGIPFAGIAATNWTFTTGLSSAPNLTVDGYLATNQSPFTAQLTFDKAVSGLTTNSFVVTNGTVSSLTGGNTLYQVSITPTAIGDVTIALPPGAASGAGISSDSLFSSIEYETVAPTVVLSSEVSGATTNPAIPVVFSFSEKIRGLVADSLSITNGIVRTITAINDTSYKVLLTPLEEGDVSVSLTANKVTDLAGNGNLGSNTFETNYQIDFRSGMTAFYPLDQNINTSGQIRDRSGRNQWLSIFSAPGYGTDRFGNTTGAALYSGQRTDGLNTSIPGDGTVGMSYSIWVKPTDTLQSGVAENVFVHQQANNVIFSYRSSGVYFQTTDADNQVAMYSLLDTMLLPSNWYHLVVSISAGDSLRFYLNGVQEFADAAPTALKTDGRFFALAKYFGNGGNGFQGSLDEVRIYNRFLTQAEVSSLYMLSSAVSRLAPIPDISLTEDLDSATVDLSGYFAHVNNSTLSYRVDSISSNVSSQLLMVQNGSAFTFSGKPDFTGTVPLVFTAMDADSIMAKDTIDVVVAAVDDAPRFSISDTFAIRFDDLANTFNLIPQNPSDEAGDVITYALNKTDVGFATASIDAQTGAITLTKKLSAVNRNASDTLIITANQTSPSVKSTSKSIVVQMKTTLLADYPLNGDLLDVSGRQYNFNTSSANFVRDRFGNKTSALSFDGNDVLKLNPQNHAFAVDSAGEFTLDFWAKKPSGTNAVTLFQQPGTSPDFGFLEVQVVNDSIKFRVAEENGISDPQLFLATVQSSSDTYFSPDVYHHIALSRASNAVYELYLDGAMAAQLTYAQPNAPLLLSKEVLFGAAKSGVSSFNNYLSGEIDDIQLYDILLSGSEIELLADPAVKVVGEIADTVKLCEGLDFLNPFTISGGASVEVQWLKDGGVIAPVSIDTLIKGMTLANQGQYQFVTGADATFANADTATFFLMHEALPDALTFQRDTSTISVDSGFAFYRWFEDDVLMANTTNHYYTPTSGVKTIKVEANTSAGCMVTASKVYSSKIVYVDANASGIIQDGTSWATAYTSLRLAYMASNDPAQLWVADGTYKVTDASNQAEFIDIKPGRSIYGGFEGTETVLESRDPLVNLTVITGDIAGNDTSVVSEANEASFSENSNFLIQARGNAFATNTFVDGITLEGSRVRLAYVQDARAYLIFDNCVFQRNLATNLLFYTTRNSNGVASENGLEIRNSRIIDNYAPRSIGGSYNDLAENKPTRFRLINSLVANNIIGTEGGALNAMFSARTTTQRFRAFASKAYVDVVNSTIVANKMESATSGIFLAYGDNSWTGTLAANIVRNTIIHDSLRSTTAAIFKIGGQSGDRRNIQSNNVFSVDPFFETHNGNPYSLSPCSPAIDAADDSFLDLSFYEKDLGGNSRKVGNGLDIGAFENDGMRTKEIVITNLTLDTLVNVGDSVALIAKASSDLPLTYEWYNTQQNTSVAMGDTLTITPESLDSLQYFFVARNACNADTSNQITIAIDQLRVVNATPLEGSDGVAFGANIEIRFDDLVDGNSVADSLITILAGSEMVEFTTSTSDSSLVIDPTNLLPSRTDITVTVEGVRSASGKHMQAFELRFKTFEFKVIDQYPAKNAVSVSPSDSIAIKFNGAVSLSSVENNFKIHSRERGLLSGDYSVSNDSVVVFKPTDGFTFGENIQFYIYPGLMLQSASFGTSYFGAFRVESLDSLSISNSYTSTQLFSQSNSNIVQVAVGDADGNGTMDVGYNLGSRAQLVRGANGTGRFGTPEPLGNTNVMAFAAHMADLNNDGVTDLINIGRGPGAGSMVYHYFENGSFVANRVFSGTSTDNRSLSTADMNGDGILDIIVGRANSIIYQTPQLVGSSTHVVVSNNRLHTDVEPVDIDNDGDIDVVAATPNGIFLYRNSGDHVTFAESLLESSLARKLAVGDFDNDGDADIAFTNYGTVPALISVIDNDSVGRVFTTASVISTSGNVTANYLPIETADMNNDGILDLVTAYYNNTGNGRVQVFLGLGNGAFNTSAFLTRSVPARAYGLDIADMDQDGDLDIVYTSTSGVSLLENNTYDINEKPFVDNQPASITILEDASNAETIDLSNVFADPEGDIFTISASSDTSAISVSLSGNMLSVSVTEANYVGNSSITLTATAANGSTSTSVGVSVTEVNDKPELSLSSTLITKDEGFLDTVLVDILVEQPESEQGQMLTFSILGQSTATNVGINASNQIEITSASGFGTDTLQLVVSDGELSDTIEFIIQINDVIVPPVVLNPIPDQTGVEDLVDLTIPIENIFFKGDAQEFTYELNELAGSDIANVTLNTGSLSPLPPKVAEREKVVGKKVGEELSKSIRIVGMPDAFGMLTLELVLTNERAEVVRDTFDIVITPVNDEPTFTLATSELFVPNMATEPYSIDVTDLSPSNEASQTITYSLSPDTVDFATIVYDQATSKILVRPASGATGRQTFTLLANDGQSVNNVFSDTFTVQVVSNQPPVVTSTLDAIMLIEDFGVYQVTNNLSGLFSDPENDPLTFTVSVTDPALLDVTKNGDLVQLSSLPDVSGNTILTLKASDGISNVMMNIAVEVNPVNDAPVFSLSSQQVELIRGGAESQTILISADNPPSDEVSQVVIYTLSPSSLSFATVQLDNSNQSITVTAVQGQTGTGTVTVTANDGQSENNTFSSTFTVIVSEQNVAPHVLELSASTIDENKPVGTLIGQFSALDDNSGEMFTYALGDGGDNDFFSISGDQLLSAAIFDFETKSSYTISVTVTDQTGLTKTVSFIVTVNDLSEAVLNVEKVVTLLASPNPFDTRLMITSSVSSLKSVYIVDVNGKEVFQSSSVTNELLIDTKSWVAGVYFIHMDSGKSQQVMKLLKQ